MTTTLERQVWASTLGAREPTSVVVAGRLEAVDMRSGRFRIADDVGHRIALEDVPEPSTVAHLINQRVRAIGTGSLGNDGQLKGVIAPSITPESLPSTWFARDSDDLTAELSKPGPSFGDGVELTDEEFADFMTFLKG